MGANQRQGAALDQDVAFRDAAAAAGTLSLDRSGTLTPAAIYFIRQGDAWRILPPFGDAVDSPTALALPADQLKQLRALREQIPASLRQPAVTSQDELMLAAAGGDLAWAQDCVRRGATWAGHSIYGGSPLAVAMMCDQADIVSLLFANGVDPAAENHALLPRAIQSGDSAAVMAFIGGHKDLDRADDRPWGTPIQAAMMSGNVPAAKALVAGGAGFTPKQSAGEYVLLSARSGNAAMLDWIRGYCPDLTVKSPAGVTALQVLALGQLGQPQTDGERVARELLKAGVDPHAMGGEMKPNLRQLPLVLAARDPYRAPVVRALLDGVTYSPEELNAAMKIAAKSGAPETIAMLQKASAAGGNAVASADILYDAAGRIDNAAAIETLLAGGAAVDTPHEKTRRTPLHAAITRGDAAGVRKLLEHAANPAATDANGDASLELATLRAKNGRERTSNNIIHIEYDAEPDGHASAGAEVLAALQSWLAAHPAAAAAVATAEHDRLVIKSKPSATPSAALTAYIKAAAAGDERTTQTLVFLPDDANRRRGVLQNIHQVAAAGAAGELLPVAADIYGTVAVGRFQFRKPDGTVEAGVCPLARRGGGWLIVLDPFQGGGLTGDELSALEAHMHSLAP